jgi:hypothetical protein
VLVPPGLGGVGAQSRIPSACLGMGCSFGWNADMLRRSWIGVFGTLLGPEGISIHCLLLWWVALWVSDDGLGRRHTGRLAVTSPGVGGVVVGLR